MRTNDPEPHAPTPRGSLAPSLVGGATAVLPAATAAVTVSVPGIGA